MIEMKIENERVERLQLQQFGEAWIQAITDGAFDRLEQSCETKPMVRLLQPPGMVTLDNAADLASRYRMWFSGCSVLNMEVKRISQVGGKLGILYRYLLQRGGNWYTIEQQLYCTLKEGRVQQLDLLCSGFQPVKMNDRAARADAADGAGQPDPKPDALLEFHTTAAQAGSTCAVLTPLIRSKLREMQPGQVLEVRVDDPSARGDIEAWSRLSGNALLQVIDHEGPVLRFFVQKK